MSKVLIFSDLHIHPHKKSYERLDDCIRVLEWVFQTALERGIKNIIFLGDLYHDKEKLHVLTLQKTFEVFNKYLSSKEITVYLLVGNHDMWLSDRTDVNSVCPLGSFSGVNIIDTPRTIEIDGQEISFVPYTHDPIECIKSLKNDSKYRILCGHLAVDGAVWNVMHQTTAEVSVEHDGDLIKIDKGIFQSWDQVFLGHYHAQQKLNENIEYIGSPLQLSFGEAFQHKHILIYDIKDHSKEYLRNLFSPQHFIIPVEDMEKYEQKNNFFKIEVSDLSLVDAAEIRNSAVKNGVSSLEIKQARTDKIDESVIKEAKSVLHGDEVLNKYVELEQKAGNTEGLDCGLLLEIGKTIYGGISLA